MARGYKAACPQCGGDNLYVTPDNGMTYCFNCEYRSSPESENRYLENAGLPFQNDEGALAEIRALYTAQAQYYHSCMTREARAYANSRGITDESIQKFKLGYCPETLSLATVPDIYFRAGLLNGQQRYTLAGRLTFPYVDPTTSQIVDIRGRSLDNSEPKYKGPFGTTGSRGAGEWPFNSQSLKGDHIITEGEIKSIIAEQLGFRTVGLPGIATWRWRLRSMAKGRQTVVFDSQAKTATRESVYAAIDKLAQRIPNLHIATLPLGKETKMDLDTYLLTKGAAEFKLILDKALPYNEWATLLRRPYVLRQGR